MKNVDARYWIELAMITLLLVILGWVVFEYLLPGLYPKILPVMLALLVGMTATGQIILTRLMTQKFSKFNSAFLIYKALKILVLMIFMIVYSLLNRTRAVPFLGATFVIYLVMMIFESRSLNRHSRKLAQR